MNNVIKLKFLIDLDEFFVNHNLIVYEILFIFQIKLLDMVNIIECFINLVPISVARHNWGLAFGTFLVFNNLII